MRLMIFVCAVIGFAYAGNCRGDDGGQLDRRKLVDTAGDRAAAGDWASAMKTLSKLRHPRHLADGLQSVAAVASSDHRTGDRQSPHAGTGASGFGAGAFADFEPLIDLIESTIVPETWEDAGGASTIREYANGIVVDATGLVSDVREKPQAENVLADINVLLADSSADRSGEASSPDAWRMPAKYRCVSLRGVAREVAEHRLSGRPIPDDLRHLAGLSAVNALVLQPEHGDVILIGTVSGIESAHGALRDRVTGLPPIKLDMLAAAIVAAASGEPMGCSIDPNIDSLAAASEISEAIRIGEIPPGLAADKLAEALGEQSIRLFGIDGATPLAHLLVEADRHMKQLALGFEPLPPGVDDYFDKVRRHLAAGPPDGRLLRLWFTAEPLRVHRSDDGLAFSLAGRGLKLAGEKQVFAGGRQRPAGEDDPRLIEFVDGFNAKFDEIVRLYPAYGELQSVYQAAAVIELIRRHAEAVDAVQLLAPLLLDDVASLEVPRRVRSIAASKWLRHGSRRHLVVVASGGVRVEPQRLIPDTIPTYPTVDAAQRIAEMGRDAASRQNRWWWNASP